MLVEKILTLPGFLYEIGNKYYYLGKWICKECTELDATDCGSMYQMCRAAHEEPDTNMYFQKIRAHADFALEIPYNPAQIKEDMTALIGTLSDTALESLKKQVEHFEEDLGKYC